ncbi:MAG: hypothetical protein JWQ09_5654, partial [Segetibacter sp.]|nr:hypothetical protein [Segetibacter sp.]
MTPEIPVSQRIKAFNASLLPEMVKLKYRLLADNPFRFYRGTNHLFYEDLVRSDALPASPNVWLAGDLHLENFGSYKGDNRQVYFDISDFDEGILGPALWDVIRMATSIFVGFDVLNVSAATTEKCATTFIKKYSETLESGKARGIELGTAKGIIKELLKKVSKRKAEKWLQQRIKKNGKGTFVFKEIENRQLRIGNKQLKNRLIDHIRKMHLYKKNKLNNFKVHDACCRIAGTGSLGLKRYLFLLETETDRNRFWLLDMKQARQSSLSPHVKVEQPSWSSEADRIITINFRMQHVPIALLTTTLFNTDAYIIKEMQPTIDKIDFHLINDSHHTFL